jgi:hypothetical protein
VRERGASRGLSAGYLEPDNREEEGSEDEGAISLAAIKNKYKNKTAASKSEYFSLRHEHISAASDEQSVAVH